MDRGSGVRAPVIDLESLIALKVKIGRGQDEADQASPPPGLDDDETA